jgi:uncharacterized protein (DUF305 family)
MSGSPTRASRSVAPAPAEVPWWRAIFTPRYLMLLLGLAIAAIVAAVVLAQVDFGGGVSDDSADAGFLRDMSVHHDQAVEMALIIRDRTADGQLQALATDIVLTQASQIGTMGGWLQIWDLPQTGEDLPMTWMGHPTEGLMPGMATSEEIQQLRDLPVDQAEVLFLQLMIRHHQSGVEMAGACLESCDEDVVTQLAQGIVAAQQSEINVMNTMLAARGTPPEPAAPPAEHETGEHATGSPAAG